MKKILLVEDGDLLRRTKDDVPGGRVDFGEQPEMALRQGFSWWALITFVCGGPNKKYMKK